ncbi:DNA-binding response regulator, partial [Streptomyces sp. McG3]|nr:DNA-binding response regulator [Streptomyces sp. McG3]
MPDDVSPVPNRNGASAHHHAPQYTSAHIPLAQAPGPAG